MPTYVTLSNQLCKVLVLVSCHFSYFHVAWKWGYTSVSLVPLRPWKIMPGIPGYVIIMLPKKAHIMLNYVMGFNLWPKGQARCCEYGKLWLHAAVMLQYNQPKIMLA